MKKILLALLLVSGIVQAEVAIDPSDSGPFEAGRIVSQKTSGAWDRVITDKKTGCQYAFQFNTGTGSVLLGCFPEFIDPKFKK